MFEMGDKIHSPCYVQNTFNSFYYQIPAFCYSFTAVQEGVRKYSEDTVH